MEEIVMPDTERDMRVVLGLPPADQAAVWESAVRATAGIVAELDRLRRRVTELLIANTAEVEKRRDAEADREQARFALKCEWEARQDADKRLTLTRGAMAAQDEREQQAGERCGVSYVLHNCDWPEAVADEVLALRARIAELGEQLEADRTKVAECMTAANRAIDGRYWLTEGRGPYEWDDDRYQAEFHAAAVEIKTALEPLTKIAANWSGCPIKSADVAKARLDLKARITELEHQIEADRAGNWNPAYLTENEQRDLALERQRDRAEAERDAAREDVARLDWLERDMRCGREAIDAARVLMSDHRAIRREFAIDAAREKGGAK